MKASHSSAEVQNVVHALEAASTERGARLMDLCAASPVLLVFLRHAGCTFCREALSDLARDRSEIENSGSRIVLIHMGDSEAISVLLGQSNLLDLDRIRDDSQDLYRAFGLKRGTLRQLFGPKVLWRAFGEGVLARHGIGWQKADSFQMPGVFLLDTSGIARRFRHRTAADRPNYPSVAAPVISEVE